MSEWTYSHRTGNSEENTLEHTIFCIVGTNDVGGNLALRGEGIDWSEWTGEFESAEGVEGAVWESIWEYGRNTSKERCLPLLILGSSSKGCLGVAMSWMILCVF